jgi:hypothetical protein
MPDLTRTPVDLLLIIAMQPQTGSRHVTSVRTALAGLSESRSLKNRNPSGAAQAI